MNFAGLPLMGSEDFGIKGDFQRNVYAFEQKLR